MKGRWFYSVGISLRSPPPINLELNNLIYVDMTKPNSIPFQYCQYLNDIKNVNPFDMLGYSPVLFYAIHFPCFLLPQVLMLHVNNGTIADGITEIFSNDGHLISGSSVASIYDNKMLIGSVIEKLVYCELRSLDL